MSEAQTTLSLPRRLWLLFFTFARIAALVVGGGLAMLPVIEEEFVTKKRLLSQEELLDMVTLTQTMPGIIAANSAVYIGSRIAGFPGAVAALFGAVLPSFTVIVLIAWLFPTLKPSSSLLLGVFAGVRAGVTGLIVVTAWKLAKKGIRGRFEALAAGIFLILALRKFSPALIIVSGMILGVLHCKITEWRLRKRRG